MIGAFHYVQSLWMLPLYMFYYIFYCFFFAPFLPEWRINVFNGDNFWNTVKRFSLAKQNKTLVVVIPISTIITRAELVSVLNGSQTDYQCCGWQTKHMFLIYPLSVERTSSAHADEYRLIDLLSVNKACVCVNDFFLEFVISLANLDT